MADRLESFPRMNPYRKAVAAALRLIALALIIVPLILLGLDYFAAKTHHGTTPKSSLALKTTSVVAGVILLFASGTIAKKVTEDLEE